jgi:glycosyltransferase 2 family protein
MSDQPHQLHQPSTTRRVLVMIAKIAVSIALLVFLFSRGGVDVAKLWAEARRASVVWLIASLGVYALNMIASAWRWHLLLRAQRVPMGQVALFNSLMVAQFFNNFLPSNIGGDVIRIRDTAKIARSKTLATTVVLVDRGLGLMALVLIAAFGASMAAQLHGSGASPIWPSWLWAIFFIGAALSAPAVFAPAGVGRLLQPLTVFHPEWIGNRIETMIGTLGRFRSQPSALVGCFGGAIVVQALVVVFYATVAHALHVPIRGWDLAVIVPLSIVMQMLPVSVNGFGVREATFTLYFTRIGLPTASGVLLSLVGAAVIMFFSLLGAVIYVTRGR